MRTQMRQTTDPLSRDSNRQGILGGGNGVTEERTHQGSAAKSTNARFGKRVEDNRKSFLKGKGIQYSSCAQGESRDAQK